MVNYRSASFLAGLKKGTKFVEIVENFRIHLNIMVLGGKTKQICHVFEGLPFENSLKPIVL